MKKVIFVILLIFLINSNITYVQAAEWGVEMVLPEGRPDSSKSVQIAILDSGIDLDHPDLKDHITWTHDMTGGEGYDSLGHGTAIAGVIVQVSPLAEIYNIKIANIPSFGESFEFDLFEALNSAMQGPDGVLGTSDDADILNLSLGEMDEDVAADALFETAFDRNIAIVAAGGNEGDGSIDTIETTYPASSDYVIGVGAFEHSFITPQVSSFSSTGPQIEISAPGESIRTMAIGGEYRSYSGTSLAAPFVSAVLSLYIGEHGKLPIGSKDTTDGNTLRGILHNTAMELGPEGYDYGFGYGCVQYQSGITVIRISTEQIIFLTIIGGIGLYLLLKKRKEMMKFIQKAGKKKR